MAAVETSKGPGNEAPRYPKIRIKTWRTVATWRWVANDDTCGICRMPFNSCCPDCHLPGDSCPIASGSCSHCFHSHCIRKWLSQQQSNKLCPMCRQEWSAQSEKT